MIINVDAETGACDKTFNEIVEAAQTKDVLAIITQNEIIIYYARLVASVNREEDSNYILVFAMPSNQGASWSMTTQKAIAETADSIPYFDIH